MFPRLKLSVRFTRLANSTPTATDTATANTGSDRISPSVIELFDVEPGGADLLFMGPTMECVCGNTVFHALVWFDSDTREIGGWFTEMKCAVCGAVLRGATPVDEEASQ